jgi:hypothetical protein
VSGGTLSASVTTTAASPPVLWGTNPGDHHPDPLHGSDRTYLETNCYADVLIELLSARGDDPRALFGFIVRTDWEGDQFSYFKPPYADLFRLFGVEVHEMLPYKTVPEHVERQLALGRTVLVEIDAWWLPDTASTSYRREHLKTTVAPTMIDREAERMQYFHNAGLFELTGEDYRGSFRMLPQFTDDVMDPFIEVVRFDAGPRLQGDELRDEAQRLLASNFALKPARNPFVAWAESLREDLPRLLVGSAEDYHAYAFVTVRMVGAAFELLGDHIRWLFGADGTDAAAGFQGIVEGSKTVSFRLARRRAFDPEPVIAGMAEAWDQAMDAIGQLLG